MTQRLTKLRKAAAVLESIPDVTERDVSGLSAREICEITIELQGAIANLTVASTLLLGFARGKQ